MELPIWAIVEILFIRSMGTAFRTLVFSATTPLIVPTEELTKYAGYAQTIQAVSSIISSGAAAFLYSVWPLNAIILLDIAGPRLYHGRNLGNPDPQAMYRTKKPTIYAGPKRGLYDIKKRPGSFRLAVDRRYLYVFYMPTSSLYPLITMSYFKGAPAHTSAAEIAFTVGMLLGGVILSIWGGFKIRRYTIFFSILLMGVSITISGCLPPDAFIVFAVCCLCMGFAAPFYGMQNAIFQEQVKPEYLRRVFSLLTSAVSLAMPLGLVISGPMAEKFGVEKWFVICGTGIIIVAFAAFFLPGAMEIDGVNADNK